MPCKTIAAAVIGGLLVACAAPYPSGTPGIPTESVSLPTARVIPAPSRPAATVPGTPASGPPVDAPLPTTRIIQQAPPSSTPASYTRFLPLAVISAPPATAAITPALTLPSPAQPGEESTAREGLLVAAINQVRAANNLPPYLHNPVLSAAARAHSCDLAAHGVISHTSSDGRTLAERLAGSEPLWEWPSESIAAGTDDPATVVAWWMDEPPEGWHRRNILDLDQREVGVGYCYTESDPSGNHHYWTADFSRHPGQ